MLFGYFWIEDNVQMQTTTEVVELTVLTRIHFSIDLRQNSVNAPGASPGQGAGSGQNAASGGQDSGNMQLSGAGMAGSYIHGGKSKGAALNMSTQNPQGSMNSMRLRNLKGGK